MMAEFLTEVNSILLTRKINLVIRASKLQVPLQPAEISRAVQLLGNLTRTRLNSKSERELKRLLGDLPTDIEEAQLWKSALKSILTNLKT